MANTLFFAPGQPSPCFFSPQTQCGLFPYWKPDALDYFFLEPAPHKVFCIFPQERPGASPGWNDLFARVRRIWGDRRLGFRCERMRPEDLRATQPCDACTAVRQSQVVIIETGPELPRYESFRDMATTTKQLVTGVRERFGPNLIPAKRVILIGCGVPSPAPHVRHLIDLVDYAGATGHPDPELFAERMRGLAQGTDSSPDESVVSITPLDLEPTPPLKDPTTVPPAASVTTEQAEWGIRILDEPIPTEPSVSTGTAPPALDAPGVITAVGPVLSSAASTSIADEGLLEKIHEIDPEFLVIVQEQLSKYTERAKSKDFSEKSEFAVFRRALKRYDKGEYREAILELLAGRQHIKDDLMPFARAKIEDCLDQMTPTAVVELFFAPQIQGIEGRLELSAWGTDEPLQASLTINDADLREAIRSPRDGEPTPAPCIPLFVFEKLTPADVEALYQRLSDRPIGAGILVVGRCEEIPIGILYSQCRDRQPPLYFIEFRLSDLREIIQRQGDGFAYVHDRVRALRGDRAAPYLMEIDKIVSADGQFFGRRDLLARLSDRLRQGENFAVTGLRRLGKSSLLHRLVRTNMLPDHLPVVIDLMPWTSSSLAELYQLVVRAIRDAIDAKYPESVFPRTAFPMLDWRRWSLFSLGLQAAVKDYRQHFATDLERLFEALCGAAPLRFEKIILLFDEIDRILPDGARPGAPGVLGYQEFLAQVKHLCDRPTFMVGMVTFGSALAAELDRIECPLHDRVVLMPLGMLDKDECLEMVKSIGRRRYVLYTDQALEEIFDLSGGHPQWTKYLCASILAERDQNKKPGYVEPEDVTAGLLRLLQRGAEARIRLQGAFSVFETYYPAEADVLHVMSEHSDPFELMHVRDLSAMPPTRGRPALVTLLRKLEDYGLVEQRHGNLCRIRPGMLHHWLRDQNTPE